MKTYTEQDLIKLVNMIDNEYRQYTRNVRSEYCRWWGFIPLNFN